MAHLLALNTEFGLKWSFILHSGLSFHSPFLCIKGIFTDLKIPQNASTIL